MMVSARGWLYVSSFLCSVFLWSGLALSHPRLIEASALFFALMCATVVAMLHDRSPVLQRVKSKHDHSREWHDEHD